MVKYVAIIVSDVRIFVNRWLRPCERVSLYHFVDGLHSNVNN